MSKLKVKTQPDLSLNSVKHQGALVNDKNFTAWQYNVADHFKDKTVSEIKQHLQTTAHPFAVAMENWRGDFNFATLVRNANGFNAKEVFYLGEKKWDRRGAVGVHNYTEVQWIPTVDSFIELQKRYTIIGIDNVPGSVPMAPYVWPDNPMMVFGEEGPGLTPAMQAFCKDIVHIDMFGSVRSFNCGSASAIAMYDFVSKFTGK